MYNIAKILSKPKRRALRQRETESEKVLWAELRKLRKELNLIIKRQYSFDWFIVDFYCPSAKVAIEIDGSIHDLEEIKEYDEERQKIIEEQGVAFLRFTNQEVLSDIKQVIRKIVSQCLKN